MLFISRQIGFLLIGMGVVPSLVEASSAVSLSHQQQQHQQRSLAIGDFDELNAIFQDVQLYLGDIDLDGGISFSNVYCTQMVIGDIQTQHQVRRDNATNQDVLAFYLQASPMSLDCRASFDFNFMKGDISLATKNTFVAAQIHLESASTFQLEPPSTSSVAFCQADINSDPTTIQVSGPGLTGLLGGLLDLLQPVKDIFANVIDDLASGAICNELQVLGPDFLGNFLNQTKNLIDEWSAPLTPEMADPLFSEKSFVPPPGVSLVSFQQDTETSTNSIADVFVGFLKDDDALFGSSVVDPVTGNSEPGINEFLRSTLLNEEGIFRLELGDLGGSFNNTILDQHNRFLDAKVDMTGIRIAGLDTLQTFEAFNDIGAYTITNDFRWEKLNLELNFTVDLKPSSLPDSMLRNGEGADPVHIVEDVTVFVDMTGLDVGLGLFLAINEESFDELPLGSLLESSNILSCLLSAVEALEVSNLAVTVEDMGLPVLTGFISRGMDRLLSNITEAGVDAYEPTLLKAFPGMFQGPVRDLLKNRLVGVGDKQECVLQTVPTSNGRSAFLDFRDLFLSAEEAKAAGASGSEPYGNIGATAYDLLQDMLTEPGDDGLPGINEAVIRPFTESQSGEIGLVRFADTLFEIGGDSDDEQESTRLLQEQSTVLGNTLQLSVGDIRISNLDTITAPLELLTITNEPTVLGNSLSLGETSKPLTAAVRLTTSIDGLVNQIDVIAEMSQLSLEADVHLMMDANKFLAFALGDILEFNCWLAALQAVALDSDGFAVDPNAERGLSLQSFANSLATFDVNTVCVSCESSGALLLPELLQILKDTNVISTLGDRLPDFLDSFAKSDTTQTLMDRMVADAPKLCPSNPLFDENAERTEYESIGFPTLSARSIDTLMFAGIVAAQTAFVIFAESKRSTGVPETDPLSSQRDFVAPEGMRLLDWTNVGNSTGLGGIADQVFDGTLDFLGGSSGLFDFASVVNEFIGDNGVLDLDTDLAFEQGDFVLKLDRVRVKGLDSFVLFDTFEPIAPQTLSIEADFDEFQVEMEVSADSPSTSDPPQVLKVAFTVEEVSANVALFAAFDLDKISALQLGSLIDTKKLLNCVMSTAHAFEIPEMKVSVGSFSTPTIEGLLPETGSVVGAALDATLTRYKTEITEAIPAMFNSVVKDMLADVLGQNDEASCAQSAVADETAFVDFRDLLLPPSDAVALGASGSEPYGDLVSLVFDYVKKELLVEDTTTGLAALNERAIVAFTKGQSGTPGRLFFETDLFNSGGLFEFGALQADVALRLSDVFVNNLDTFGIPLEILEPMRGAPYKLNNDASIGIGRPLEAGLRAYVKFKNDEVNIENDFNISINLDTLRLLLTGLVKMSEKAFMSFPVEDLTNIRCWMATIPPPMLDERGVAADESLTLVVSKFLAEVEEVGFNVTCNSCSGPLFPVLGEKMASSRGTERLTEFAEGVFDFVTDLANGNFMQVAIDRALTDARLQCPHSPTYDENFEPPKYKAFDSIPSPTGSLTFFLAFLIVAAFLVAFAVATVLITKVVVLRRHREWIAQLPTRHIDTLWKDQSKQAKDEERLNSRTTSMFLSECIPLFWRVMMPLIILGNIGFFLSGHLSLGGSVSIMFSLAGQEFRESGFFNFSMARSTIQLWEVGGRELAMLIFLFSFVWPYSKQIITMVLWFTSPSAVSVSRRGSILLWLDFLAKWSMVDVFVLVVIIVTFRIHIQSPEASHFPKDFYSIDLLVVPKWGLYANMTAQIISQLSSHVIIHYHRRIVDQARQSVTPVSEEGELPTIPEAEGALNEEKQERLCDHGFRRPHRGESQKLSAKPFVAPLLVVGSVLLCILVVIGCIVPSYSQNILGVGGVLVETGQRFEPAFTRYSVFSTMGLLLDQARLTGEASDWIGLGSLVILLVVSVLVVPVVQSVVLLMQWFSPLTKKRRHRLSILLEILQAWQYAEVYLIALLVGTWQLGPISEYMVNPYCQEFGGLFAELVYYGILDEEDAQCLRTDMSVEPTFYILFIAAIMLTIVNTFVMKAVQQYFHDETQSGIETPNVSYDLGDLSDYETDNGANRKKIKPVPVLFTDRFRWLLQSEEQSVSIKSTSHESDVVSSVNNADFAVNNADFAVSI